MTTEMNRRKKRYWDWGDLAGNRSKARQHTKAMSQRTRARQDNELRHCRNEPEHDKTGGSRHGHNEPEQGKTHESRHWRNEPEHGKTTNRGTGAANRSKARQRIEALAQRTVALEHRRHEAMSQRTVAWDANKIEALCS
jgi:hypothetical protein